MQVSIAGGTVSFMRDSELGNGTNLDETGDREPVVGASVPILLDGSILPGYVSLKCPGIRISAFNFKADRVTLPKVGWVNIIIDSTRNWHYNDGSIVCEDISNLPTWDGEAGNKAPFYFDCYVEIKDSADGEDIHFNDAPSMAPSYGCYTHLNINIGRAILHYNSKKLQMTHITGQDRYLACLTAVDSTNTYHVLWRVPWGVDFAAQVTVRPLFETPFTVAVPASAVMHINGPQIYGAPATLLNTIIGKAPSAACKRYRLISPPLSHSRARSFSFS